MSHIKVAQREFVCLKCKHTFRAEVLFRVSIPVFVAQIKAIRCPMCDADSSDIAFKFKSDDKAMIDVVELSGRRSKPEKS